MIDASGKVINGYTATYSGLPAVSAEYTQVGSIGFMQNGRYNAAASGPAYNTMKSRSATIGSWSVVSSGDALGAYRFWGDDGSSFVESARIEAFVDGTPGTNDMPGRLVFSTTADGASSVTEAMRIDSTQRVIVQKSSNGATAALTSSSASIAVDMNSANNFTHTTTENTTLANPTNMTAGQYGSIVITQGATARTMAFGSYWKFAGGTAPSLTASPGAVDVLVYYIESSTRITARLIGDVK